MAINHRLNRLERLAPRPARECPYCGFASLKHGMGTVRPGWLVPEAMGEESKLLGCKSCFAWLRVDKEPTPNPDGSYTLVGATRCGPPEYI